MNIRALALLCGVSLALVATASAQSVNTLPLNTPPGGAANDGLPPGRILANVRQRGFEPLTRPVRRGDTYALRALDPYDVEYRIVIDAHTGRTMSVREVGMASPYGGPGFGLFGRPGGPYGGPVYGRIYGSGEDGYGSPRPPRVVPGGRSEQQQAHTQSSSSEGGTPLPRPRPYVLEATGALGGAAQEPQKTTQLQTAPQTQKQTQKAPEVQKATEPPKTPEVAKESTAGKETAPNNGGGALPPVTPLD